MKTKWSKDLAGDMFYFHTPNAKAIVGTVSKNLSVGDAAVLYQKFMPGPHHFGIITKIEHDYFTIVFDDLSTGVIMFLESETEDDFLYSLDDYQNK